MKPKTKQKFDIEIIANNLLLVEPGSQPKKTIERFKISSMMTKSVIKYAEDNGLIPSAQAMEAFPYLHIHFKEGE